MPRLSCWSCGRQIYTVAPLEALFAEERRCPRCGAFLRADRREAERRRMHRRSNPTDDPGPPAAGDAPGTSDTSKSATGKPRKATSKGKNAPDSTDNPERRLAEKRTLRRRGGTTLATPAQVDDPRGWHD